MNYSSNISSTGTDNSWKQLCTESLALYNSSSLALIASGTTVANIVSIVAGTCLLILIIRFPAAFHRHTRVLLVNLGISMMIMNLGFFSRNLSYYIVALQGDPTCPFIASSSTCRYFSSFKLAGLLSINLTLVAMAVERGYATLKYQTYEDTSNPIVLAAVIALQWIVIFVAVALTEKEEAGSRELAPFCSGVVHIDEKQRLIPLCFMLATEAISAAICVEVLAANRDKQRVTLTGQSRHTLTARYQLSENIRSTKMMVPSLLAHFVCFVPAYVLTLFTLGPSRSLDAQKIVSQISIFELATSVAPIYGMVYPLICIIYTPSFNQALRKNKVRNAAATEQKQMKRMQMEIENNNFQG